MVVLELKITFVVGMYIWWRNRVEGINLLTVHNTCTEVEGNPGNCCNL
jgi:hypothetical protein